MSKKAGNHRFLLRNVLLGTNIVPQGVALIERKELVNQAVANYLAKKEAAETKEKRDKIRCQPVELRVAFIPFIKQKRTVEGKSRAERAKSMYDNFLLDLKAHDENVTDVMDKITRDWRKNSSHPSRNEKYESGKGFIMTPFKGSRVFQKTSIKVAL